MPPEAASTVAPAPAATTAAPGPTTTPANIEQASSPEVPFETRVANMKAGKPAKGDAAEASVPAANAATTDELEKARSDRAERLKALASKEREAEDRRRQRRPAPAPRGESDDVKALRVQVAELEAIKKNVGTPEGLLELAEKHGLDPMQFGQAIKERLTNPEKVAAIQAKKALTPLEERLLGEINALKGDLKSLQQYQLSKETSHADAQAANQLIAHVKETERLSPFSARYLAKHGQDRFLRYAESCAQYLPEGSGLQALSDLIEQNLEDIQLAPGEPSTPAKPNPSPAAAKATNTVTNSLASRQTSVVDDDEFARLPFEERLRIVKARQG